MSSSVSSARRLRSIAELLASKDKEILDAMSELQDGAESEFTIALEEAKEEFLALKSVYDETCKELHGVKKDLKQAREELDALNTVCDETYKELDSVKKERDQLRDEGNEALCLVGSAALRREKEITKLEEQVQSELKNVEMERNQARSALEESNKELHAARKQIYNLKNECEEVKKQRDLGRNRHETAEVNLDISGLEPMDSGMPVEQDLDNLSTELASQSSTDPPGTRISSPTSVAVCLPNPTVASKQKDTEPHPPSSHSSPTSTCHPSGTQTGRDKREDNLDQLWESDRLFVPHECTTFPGILFARDVAYLFEHIEERNKASIGKRFATMVPGVKYVYATFRAHRYLWENAPTTEREAAKNLPRQPHGLWTQWVQTCTTSQLINKRTRENRHNKAQSGRLVQGRGEESGTEEEEFWVADKPEGKEKKRGSTATRFSSNRMKR
ncbi:hypothetical protein C8R43DRAFT_942140 [Mycena crocata]|nr:hypothetical protein C8R43DRAFT_942140 [Mycena crocata]